jgi:hypothetical protein
MALDVGAGSLAWRILPSLRGFGGRSGLMRVTPPMSWRNIAKSLIYCCEYAPGGKTRISAIERERSVWLVVPETTANPYFCFCGGAGGGDFCSLVGGTMFLIRM